MSPDEIYQRAEQATHGRAQVADPQAALSSFSPDSEEPDWHAAIENAVTAVVDPASTDAAVFRSIVARVTEVLADEMELPTLEEWSAAYSEAPEEFDSEMLGFWKDGLK